MRTKSGGKPPHSKGVLCRRHLLDLGHGQGLAEKLAMLIVGPVDAVEDGVQIDPGGQSPELVRVQPDLPVAGHQELDEPAAPRAVLAAGRSGLDLVPRGKRGTKGSDGRCRPCAGGGGFSSQRAQ